MLSHSMPESKKSEKRFMRFQRMAEDLQRQTDEFERLPIAADRRMKAPDAPLMRIVPKKPKKP